MKIKNKYKYLREKYEERTNIRDSEKNIQTDKRIKNKINRNRKPIISDRKQKKK